MVSLHLRDLAVLTLFVIITHGCAGKIATDHVEPRAMGTPAALRDGVSGAKSDQGYGIEKTPAASENSTVSAPVKPEVQQYLCSLPPRASSLLEAINRAAFSTIDSAYKGEKKSVSPIVTKSKGNANPQEKSRSRNGKPKSARKPPRPAPGVKNTAAGDKILLAKLEEALLNPESTRVSLETMLSEWGESTIGVDDALVQHVTYFLKCFALCERQGTNNTLERSRKYLPQIKQAFAKHHIPEDLAFAVPFVESRFTETAQSNAGAVGMFQFLASTAMDYGVEVSCDASMDGTPGIDERLDWSKTSVAAARFLSDHRKMFNSILLALGAYHHGAGTVTKVIEEISRDGKDKSFSSIFTCNRLQSYSREYIPLCLAAAYLHRMVKGSNAIRMPEIKAQYVSIKKPTSLDKLSARHQDLKTNNPDLALADQLYCYASTGGYLLITELDRAGISHVKLEGGSLLIAKQHF